MSVRGCGQCTKVTNGHRCRRRTCKYGPMCWQHTRLVEGVEVKQSGQGEGAGLGLFATKEFQPGEFISRYGGDVLTRQQLDARYPGDQLAPYALGIGPRRNVNIDARATNSGNARYANDCSTEADPRRRRTRDCNAQLVEGNSPKKRLRATKPIHRGQEILTDYGALYWG